MWHATCCTFIIQTSCEFIIVTNTGSKFTVANSRRRWGKSEEEEECGGVSSVFSDDVMYMVWLQSNPLGAVVCGPLEVGVASWWWVWSLGCGFLLPSTSGGHSVYYLRSSVLFSHGSQRARGLATDAATLIPGSTRKNVMNQEKYIKKKSEQVKHMLAEVFLAPTWWGWCAFMYNFVKMKENLFSVLSFVLFEYCTNNRTHCCGKGWETSLWKRGRELPAGKIPHRTLLPVRYQDWFTFTWT